MGCAITKTEESVMPQSKHKAVDYKARLEHKLYLARENPEPIFDLSECDLKHVPHGIYSLCKVFRKDVLLLQSNKLSCLTGGGDLKDLGLLQKLNLRNNAFTNLTDEISLLTSLRELYLNDNQLKVLPDGICELYNLEILDVSNNKLKRLPAKIGDICTLNSLYLRGNSLDSLPTCISQCKNLTELVLDADNFIFPPQEILDNGHFAIMTFLSEKHGSSYEKPNIKITATKTITWRNENELLEEKIAQLEKIKEQRHIERISQEKYNEMIHKQELEMHDALKNDKQKFLMDLIEQQNNLELEITKLQEEKDISRNRLIGHIMQAEAIADSVVQQLLSLKGNPKCIQQLLEKEKEEEERLLIAMQSEYQLLRKKDVLAAMETLLQDEFERSEILKEYEIGRAETTKDILKHELEYDRTISEVVRIQGESQINVISRLTEDEELQRAAVAALLVRGDARSWGLVQQVMLVESQLARLTAIEMERKKLEMNEQLNDLAEMRVNLSVLLLDLLSQQGERRNQLLDTLKQIEYDKQTTVDFWLLQYQKLMDSRPFSFHEVNQSLDPVLANYLLSEGVVHCLPFLAHWVYSGVDLSELTDQQLQESGITLRCDRESILKAIQYYAEDQHRSAFKLEEPSSSQGAQHPATAPLNEMEEEAFDIVAGTIVAECVICMDATCQVVFVPCGHICCCVNCVTNSNIEICPMCRSIIERKIRVILP